MAYSHDFDPAKGFVALPSDVMEIEMSPGAFRLLVELCKMANRSGECWPSLAQLSERIGRSKAAISGYIAELRNIELLETNTQTMANGYNYRLKYCVTFWQNWRAQLSQMSKNTDGQKTERGVQPIERRVNSKNHIHKNNCSAPKLKRPNPKNDLLETVFSKWNDLSKAAPFPNFNAPVPSELVQQTQRVLAVERPKTLTEIETRSKLLTIWQDLRVDLSQADSDRQLDELLRRTPTEASLEALDATIQSMWQNHWRKPPTEEQFADMLSKSSIKNREEGLIKMLEQFLKRWTISRNKLHQTTHSNNVTTHQAA